MGSPMLSPTGLSEIGFIGLCIHLATSSSGNRWGKFQPVSMSRCPGESQTFYDPLWWTFGGWLIPRVKLLGAAGKRQLPPQGHVKQSIKALCLPPGKVGTLPSWVALQGCPIVAFPNVGPIKAFWLPDVWTRWSIPTDPLRGYVFSSDKVTSPQSSSLGSVLPGRGARMASSPVALHRGRVSSHGRQAAHILPRAINSPLPSPTLNVFWNLCLHACRLIRYCVQSIHQSIDQK